ncbi:hypothetical protein E2C01_012645 [Portunus trituberculatus]|uniref:Uncharacterized protein n=1 Tax=Portunus trituberculatus TaxID=210409 RepID=A0A5B7DES2_PORTR|nr:hypothetical protein [Portunus trituberculatus]
MYQRLPSFVVVVVVVAVVVVVKTSYFVVAPTVVRPGSVYRVVVGVLMGKERATGQIEVRAALSTVHDRQMAQAYHHLRFGETKALIMKAPEDVGSIGAGEGLKLKVEGRMGSQVIFSNTTHVAVTSRFLTMLVQMSRPIYTGGQKSEYPGCDVLVETPFFTVASEGAIAGRFGAFFLTYMPVEGSANVTVYVKEHWKLPDSAYKKVLTDQVGYVNGWQDFRYPLTQLQANHSADLSYAEVKVKVAVRHAFIGDTNYGHAK